MRGKFTIIFNQRTLTIKTELKSIAFFEISYKIALMVEW